MDRFYTEDQKALRDTARRFAQAEILPRAAAIDRDDHFDRSLYKGMADLGLFGICLREGAGGAGLDAVAACIAMEELARCSGAVANAFAIPVEAVLFFDQHGTETHKALIPQNSERRDDPRHGRLRTRPRLRCRRHEDNRYARRQRLVLNGTKAWVTLGGVADRIMVFARTGAECRTPRHLLPARRWHVAGHRARQERRAAGHARPGGLPDHLLRRPPAGRQP